MVGEGAASLPNSAPALDIGGDQVLPGLVDGHMYLDKTLTGLPRMDHAAGPTRMCRIETDKTILPHLPLSTEERAGNLIRECVARGTTHLRTHVDIDLESKLAKLEGVLAARERYHDQVTMQIVAFPQSGVISRAMNKRSMQSGRAKRQTYVQRHWDDEGPRPDKLSVRGSIARRRRLKI